MAQSTVPGLGYDFVNPDIPQTLAWEPKCNTVEEYTKVIVALYKTLRIRRFDADHGDVDYVTTRFCNLTNANLRDNIRPAHPSLGDARTTPLWIFRMLSMVKTPPNVLTRATLTEIVALLTDEDVNKALKDSFHVAATDRPDNEGLTLEYLTRWIEAALDGLTFTHNKARCGFEFNQLYDQYRNSIQNLTLQVDNMLLNLCDRTSVNQLAVKAGQLRKSMIEACEVYVKMKNEGKQKNAHLALQEFREVDAFNFEHFRQRCQNGILWLNFISLQNPDDFSPLTIKEIKDFAEKLTPLVKDIRGFNPSSADLARDKAARVKVAVDSLRAELDEFLDNRNIRTLAKAKSLLGSLNFYKDKCEQLRIEGISYTDGTLGATPQRMTEYYEEVFKYIAEEEQEVKKREHRDRLEASEILKTAPAINLPPLHSVSDWLNFKAVLDRIMPIHKSDIVKCTIVRKALREKADISRCQNLDYEGIMSYLNSRYNDSSLIPRLIDKLLTMKPAKDNVASYNNLTEFLSIWAQLELHQGTDRLDSFVREKLVPLLLPNHLQCDFLAEQIKQEKEWKRDQQTSDVVDSASTTFSIAKGEEYDDRRRENFVAAMKVYGEIMRKCVATSIENNRPNLKKNNTGVNIVDQRSRFCPACNSQHSSSSGNGYSPLSNCMKFKSMPVKERYNLVVQHKYCKRCLYSKEECNNTCRNDRRFHDCKVCQRPSHHELLHLDQGNNNKNGNKTQRNNKGKKKKKSPQGTKSNTRTDSVQVNCVMDTPNQTWACTSKVETHQAVRMFLSACSYITTAPTGSHLAVILSLLDNGAGMNFILKSTAERLQLKLIKMWHGTISTINNQRNGEFPMYLLPVKDNSGNTHNVAAIAIETIGYKTALPTELFSRICKSLNVNPNLVQNTSGEIEIILGLDKREFLARPAAQYGKIPTNGEFPGVELYNTTLSPMYLIVGAVGPALAENQDVATRMYNVNTTTCHFSDAVTSNSDNQEDTSDSEVTNHNHGLDDFGEYFLGAEDNNQDNHAVLPETIPTSREESSTQAMALLEIKKTAATLSHLDAAVMPDLMCPACKVIVKKCKSCNYLNSDASIQDLEELEIIRANMQKIPDPEDPSKFFIKFDYVFKDDPRKLYSPELSNGYLAKMSALRLRKRLLKEKLMDSFHQEMIKSINHGHFAEVEGKFKEQINKTGVVNFINFNYVIKLSSLSQSCRPVSDSTAYHKSGNLNSKLLAGVQSINNPLHIVFRFLWSAVGWSADYSRAYRSVITGDVSNSCRRFYWFKDPLDETTITEYCLIRLNYGDSCSSAALEEAIRGYIAPQCTLELSKNILSWNRYIDDTLWSFDDLEQMDEVQQDIRDASSKANFTVKHTLYTGCQPVDDDKTSYTNVLGMQWWFTEDRLACNIRFNTYPKKRGKPTGPDLTIQIALTTPINRIILCRLAGQSFSFTQAQLLPVTMNLRIMFSQASMLTQEWNEDISHIDEEFTQQVRRTLSSLASLDTKISSVPRAVCPTGYKPWRICVSSDGSIVAAAACIHVVARDSTGDTRVTNIAARGKITKSTVPNAELSGATLAVNMAVELFEAIPDLQTMPVELVLVTDSLCLCSSLNPRKLYKSVKVRNSCFMIHKQISDLVNKYKNVVVKYAHIMGTANPSDYATKITNDPTTLVNSNLWRYGPNFYRDESWPPEEITFIKADHDNLLVYQPPVAQQHHPVPQSDDNSASCNMCLDNSDFCGITTTICSHCLTNDPQCFSAHTHSTGKNKDPPIEKDPLVSVDEEDHFQGYLDYKTYCNIIINSRSIIKVVNIVVLLCRLAKFINKKKNGSTNTFSNMFPTPPSGHEKSVAWRIILRSTQKYFKPTNIASWFPYVDQNGILKGRSRFRDPNHESDIITMNSPPLISHRDHRISTLLVRHAHEKYVGENILPIHLQKSITMANLRNSSFPAEITFMSIVVKRYIKQCIRCVRLQSSPIPTSLGNPRWLRYLQEKTLPFRIISVDPIGPYSYRIVNSRGPPRKAFVMVISCMLTTSTACYVMTGMTKQDVYTALSNHFQRFRPAKVIYTDAGTNLKLNPNDSGWIQHFGSYLIDIINLGTEEFYASYVESKIKIMKKMIKSGMNSRNANKLPTLTLPEMSNFFDTLSNLINSRPLFLSANGDFLLTPNHLLKNWLSVEDFKTNTLSGDMDPQINTFQDQIENLCKSLNLGLRVFLQHLKDTFISSTKNHKILQKQATIPRQGDIVLVSRREELSLGITEKVKDPYCWVRRKKNNVMVTERINFRKIYLLHRPYPNDEPPATNSNILELRKTKGLVQTRIGKDNKTRAHIIIPSSFDDVLLCYSYQYWWHDEDGAVNILQEDELEV